MNNSVDYFIKLVGILVFLLLFSCRISSRNNSVEIPGFVHDFLNTHNDVHNYSFIYSPDRKYVLCILNPEDKKSEIVYSVYKVAETQELLSSAFIGSEVRWYSNDEIVILGTSRLINEPTTVINILTKKTKKIFKTSKRIK